MARRKRPRLGWEAEVRAFFRNIHFGLLALAAVIAFLLWTIAHGTSPIEMAFDVPVELHGLDEEYVVIGQSTDAINLRVAGSRASLRNLSPTRLTYRVDLVGSKLGESNFEVNVGRLELPLGARAVSHSPSNMQVQLEKRGRKSVGVRVELAGELAPGYRIREVRLDPSRVWLTGARSQVLEFDEVVTEPIDISGLSEDREVEAKLFVGAGTVWLEEENPIRVVVAVEPVPEPESDLEQGAAVPEEAPS